MKQKIILFFQICLLFCFISCNRNQEIVFDSSQPLALCPDVQWAVVIDPYVSFRQEIGWNSIVEGHCRKGAILQVLGRNVVSSKDVWYLFDEGWLPESSISVFSNRYKAESFAKTQGLLWQ